MALSLNNLVTTLDRVPEFRLFGRVTAVQGLLIEVGGVERTLSVGARCHVVTTTEERVTCEVVGFRNDRALLMPFQSVDGIGLGCRAEVGESHPHVSPSDDWLGRVINAMGEPIDGGPPLHKGHRKYRIRNAPPPAHSRQRVEGKVDLGIRALNTFVTCCKGQRLGVFSGSGVGKSVMLSMMARNTTMDVSVIGLIGERGREVQEFIEDNLGAEGLARSVVVVATSDESPLLRHQAALMTMTVAEYFRDQEKDVLCLMDSITRFAMSQREIGLSAGEPPTTKGYPPTVFAELPKLLERAGPGIGKGSITGLFTVLVEGDDHSEPVADALRAILDGHIVLERSIAERGRYPAVDILRSISRSLPDCNADDENALLTRAKELISAYEDMAEMIRLGAYRHGSDSRTDEAIAYYAMLDGFLAQGIWETCSLDQGYVQLAEILNSNPAAMAEGDATPEAAAQAGGAE